MKVLLLLTAVCAIIAFSDAGLWQPHLRPWVWKHMDEWDGPTVPVDPREPNRPSFPDAHHSAMNETAITSQGNLTFSNGYQWFSRNMRSLRLQGCYRGELYTNIARYDHEKEYLVVGSSCTTRRLDHQGYNDYLDLIHHCKYVGTYPLVTSSGIKQNVNEWSGQFHDGKVQIWTQVDTPYNPVRVLIVEKTEGMLVDYGTFYGGIPNNNVFDPPRNCSGH
eukprot:TRINITY_DN4134_c0_g1_i1.p1 TRINITY_DN4134_c0_g1~~TRINITY_DN4134_c0_g1_i1.p1  ORF type:complete len:220 (-),score=9.70 TRINITY_DN4134_c0_g1_i1:167-826(-)